MGAVWTYVPAKGAFPVSVMVTDDSVAVAASKVKEPVIVSTSADSAVDAPEANT